MCKKIITFMLLILGTVNLHAVAVLNIPGKFKLKFHISHVHGVNAGYRYLKANEDGTIAATTRASEAANFSVIKYTHDGQDLWAFQVNSKYLLWKLDNESPVIAGIGEDSNLDDNIFRGWRIGYFSWAMVLEPASWKKHYSDRHVRIDKESSQCTLVLKSNLDSATSGAKLEIVRAN